MNQSSRIDLDHLDHIVDGDQDLRDEVLAIYEAQAEEWAGILDPVSDDGAWKDAAHALKGASRGVGAWSIGNICEAAEALIGEGRDEAARRKVVDDLCAAIKETVAEVRRLQASRS